MLLQRRRHLLYSFILLSFALNPELGLCSEHGGQKLSILSNLLQFLKDLFLELLGLLQPWVVPVLISTYLVFLVLDLSSESQVVGVQVLNSLLLISDRHLSKLKLLSQLIDGRLLVKMVLGAIVLVLVIEVFNQLLMSVSQVLQL